ncbi:condensation domain-containing protein [Streptomyces sp. NRRL S-1022]|uniref:condensation domain-containing protein n=1 Tax=Streptomyces sp. NRRL S-1022 TaxID=1463880 RepID=UPI00131C8E7A|nr:condensation domain-containing protein [Streptomyces sp. NRRL S-1022]
MSDARVSAYSPLTAGQELHWRALSQNPGWVTGVWRLQTIAGELDPDSLLSGIDYAVQRNAALRIGMSVRDGVPRQFLRPHPPAHRLVTARAVRAASPDQFNRYVQRLWRTEMGRSWDLAQDYPFRFFLVRYSSACHVLLAGFSHLAVDGTACNLIMSDIWEARAERRDAEQADERYLAVVANHAGRRAGRQASAEQHWANRAASIPPVIQFWGDGEQPMPDAKAQVTYEPLRLAGQELSALREAVADAACTEFQWVLTVFAACIFALSPLDRIKVSVVVDMRGASERDMAGMFAMRVPLIIDRQPAAEDLLPHVQRQLLQSIRACRRADPLKLHEALERKAGEMGRSLVDDLSINYMKTEHSAATRRGAGIEVSEASVPEGARFDPAGLDFQVSSRPECLTYSFIADEKVMPFSVQRRFLTAFGAALPVGAAAVAEALADGRASRRQGLSRITDPQGRAVLAVSTRDLERAIRDVEGVISAEVEVRRYEAATDMLRAHVVAQEDVSVEAIRDHLIRGARENRFLAVPRSITIEMVERESSSL